jgi:hypothetical protein
MSWQEEVKQYMEVVLKKGRGEIVELQKIFEIYNNNRAEITGSQHAEREIAPHCSACVQRVISRLQTYLNAQRD